MSTDIAWRWHGNQHGSFIIWLDGTLKDLDIAVQVKPCFNPDAWMAVIHTGYRSGSGIITITRDFPSKEDAKKYCEEYIAHEFREEYKPYFG